VASAKQPRNAFARAGASDIVLVARTASKLDAVSFNIGAKYPKTMVSTAECDVTSEPDVLKLIDLIKMAHSSFLDVLINNAGYIDAGWQPHHQPRQ
jgi:short-subunit dehydrogenase